MIFPFDPFVVHHFPKRERCENSKVRRRRGECARPASSFALKYRRRWRCGPVSKTHPARKQCVHVGRPQIGEEVTRTPSLARQRAAFRVNLPKKKAKITII